MNLFLITASHDQHVGLMMAAQYVSRAVGMLPKQIGVGWIIADDGQHSVFEDGAWDVVSNAASDARIQVVALRRPATPSGLRSFIGNMRESAVTMQQVCGPEDIVAVIEDDWFSMNYLSHAVAAFKDDPALYIWGETRTRYYRVDNRRYHVFNANGRAALSATVMRARWAAREIVRWADRANPTMMLDDVLWRRAAPPPCGRMILHPESRYVVGIKGLPGTKGLGIGSDMADRHAFDRDGIVLREWVGEDAGRYMEFFTEG